MKRHLLLFPLIVALGGLTHADDAAKPAMNDMDKMDMKSMSPKGDMKPGGDMHDMKAMHEKCMGDGKSMDDMKGMHNHCMQGMDSMKPADKAKKATKKPKHRKGSTAKPEAAPEHDHNHGAAPDSNPRS